MAYIQKSQLPENEKNQFARTGDTTSMPIPPQTGGSAGAVAGGKAGAPGVGTSTQFGSNAAKLSDYLTANAPQVAEFGQKVAGDLSTRYNNTMNTLNQGFDQFGQQVQQGYAHDNPDLVNQAYSNPTEFVKNDDNVKGFQSLYNNEYKGPQNIESMDVYGNMNNAVNKAVEDAGLVGSESGLRSYLSNYMGGNMRTDAMNTLDTALLRKSPEARETISNEANKFSTLSDYLKNQTASADQSVVDAKKAANDISQRVQNQLGSDRANFDQGIADRVSQAQQDYDKRYAAVNNAKAVPTADLIDMFGMNPEQVNKLTEQANLLSQLYGINPTNLYSSNMPLVTAPSLGNVISQEEVDKSNAYAKLMGIEAPNYGENIGTYKTPTLDVDKAAGQLFTQRGQEDNKFINNFQQQQSSNPIIGTITNSASWEPGGPFGYDAWDPYNPSPEVVELQRQYKNDPEFKKYIQAHGRISGNSQIKNYIDALNNNYYSRDLTNTVRMTI